MLHNYTTKTEWEIVYIELFNLYVNNNNKNFFGNTISFHPTLFSPHCNQLVLGQHQP